MLLFLLRLVITILMLPALFIVLALITSNYITVKNLEKSPKLIAQVVKADVDSQKRSKGVSHCPRVIVKYIYANKTYSAPLTLGPALCSQIAAVAKKLVSKYKPGNSVDIKVIHEKADILKPYAATYSLGFMHYLLIAVELTLTGVLALLWFYNGKN